MKLKMPTKFKMAVGGRIWKENEKFGMRSVSGIIGVV